MRSAGNHKLGERWDRGGVCEGGMVGGLSCAQTDIRNTRIRVHHLQCKWRTDEIPTRQSATPIYAT